MRVVLFQKAFDLIDRNLLVQKIFSLAIPRGVALWVVDFLALRHQRDKLLSGRYSEWGLVPAGVPQGTKLGLWLFILMINDLPVNNVHAWKYVDDTTIAEIVPSGGQSNIQSAVDVVQGWSNNQSMQLNADKCKELIVDFKKRKDVFDPVRGGGKDLSKAQCVKILGVTIANDLIM